MFKTRYHRAYDQVTTYLRSKNVGMMGQRSYDWWQRSWVNIKGQISRNKFDGHVQNLKPAIPNRKRSHD